MISPKEKALELIIKFQSGYIENGFSYQFQNDENDAKHCALICVDEIIKSNPTNPLTGGYIELYSDMIDEAIEFWQEVKSEIEKL
jgi:hypothetical protein